MVSLILIAGCLLLVLVAAVVIGIVVVMQSGQRDVVSGARQGWINRRSDKDDEGW